MLLIAGAATFRLPLLFTARAMSQDLGHDRAQMLSHSTLTWLIGGPISFVLGILGILVMVLVVYFDSKRKERSAA